MVLKYISIIDHPKVNIFIDRQRLSFGNSYYINKKPGSEYIINIEMLLNEFSEHVSIIRIYNEKISGDNFYDFLSSLKYNHNVFELEIGLIQFLDVIFENELYEIDDLKVIMEEIK